LRELGGLRRHVLGLRPLLRRRLRLSLRRVRFGLVLGVPLWRLALLGRIALVGVLRAAGLLRLLLLILAVGLGAVLVGAVLFVLVGAVLF
jgi:hypothetical protein